MRQVESKSEVTVTWICGDVGHNQAATKVAQKTVVPVQIVIAGLAPGNPSTSCKTIYGK
jgi:hypothetical protein